MCLILNTSSSNAKVLQVIAPILELLYKYFRLVPPLKMLWHLVWITLVLCVMSITYIITFHFEPVIALWQQSRSMEHFRTELATTLAVDARINDELTLAVQQTNADRAYVFRYHNGIPSVGGIPFMFHTNTHEVIRPGVTRVISLMQRIPSSINVHMNHEFTNHRCVTLTDIDKDTATSDYWYFQSRGSKQMIRCAIYSNQGDLLGFVGLDYLGSVTRGVMNGYEERLKNTSAAVGVILQQRN